MFAIIPQLLDILFIHPVYGLKPRFGPRPCRNTLAYSQQRSPMAQAAVEIKSF